jgi:hypothetical protein
MPKKNGSGSSSLRSWAGVADITGSVKPEVLIQVMAAALCLGVAIYPPLSNGAHEIAAAGFVFFGVLAGWQKWRRNQ